MSLGLSTFRLTPSVFWALSLPEWRALITPPSRGAPLTRDDFEQLMLQHPD